MTLPLSLQYGGGLARRLLAAYHPIQTLGGHLADLGGVSEDHILRIDDSEAQTILRTVIVGAAATSDQENDTSGGPIRDKGKRRALIPSQEFDYLDMRQVSAMYFLSAEYSMLTISTEGHHRGSEPNFCRQSRQRRPEAHLDPRFLWSQPVSSYESGSCSLCIL